jgi:ADP-ribose pyrophosphatase YjhB (NUDIX family)
MAEPEFVPKPGQVDYTNIRYCPVINCIVRCDEILLQQRDPSLRLYPGRWSGVSGFLDTNDAIEEKVYEELSEEVGISRKQVKNIKVGQVFVQEAPDYGKTWIVFPILVTVANKETTLNW